MDPRGLLPTIWRENELAVQARSLAAHARIAQQVAQGEPEVAFAQLWHVYRQPLDHWPEVAMQVWRLLQHEFPGETPEFEHLLAGAQTGGAVERETARLWLWRHAVRSSHASLLASRFFADDHLFHRTLQEDRLILWYGARVAEWPLQLLLAMFLGSGENARRLRLQLCWPTAKLPAGFAASRAENRILRRLWEARILVRFGNWAHLHPLVMLQLPEVSSFSSPVFKWHEHQLEAHTQDGRVWPIAPFSVAALLFDESLALFGRDRRALWQNFVAYARACLRRPEDAASRFILHCFAEFGLRALADATRGYLHEFAESVLFFENLRITLSASRRG